MHTYIGTGVTIYSRGFSESYTVIKETKSLKTLTIQKDIVNLETKLQYHQTEKSNINILINQKDLIYNYQPDKNGKILKIRLIKNGSWKIIDNVNFDYYIELGIRKESHIYD